MRSRLEPALRGGSLPEDLLHYLAQRVHQGTPGESSESKAESACCMFLQIVDQLRSLNSHCKDAKDRSLHRPHSSGWPLNLTPCLDTTDDLETAEAALEEWTSTGKAAPQNNDIEVMIESMEIGITVENVLERTVVHLVKEGSTARAKGVKAGDLLLEVHGNSTASLSHYETVEALKRAPRPGRLRFRPLPRALLEKMRHRMHRLIVAQDTPPSPSPPSAMGAIASDRPLPNLPAAAPVVELARLGRRALDLGTSAVTEWAARCVVDVLRAYVVALCCSLEDGKGDVNQNAVEEIDSTTPFLSPRVLSAKSRSQLRVMIATLCAFEQKVVAQYTSMAQPGTIDDEKSAFLGVSSVMVPVMVPHKSRSKAIGDLVNMLVGLGPTSQGLDWEAPELEPLTPILVNVMCVLLEADVDLTLENKIPVDGPASREEEWPLLRFSLDDEPTLKDGGASAALVCLVRATAKRIDAESLRDMKKDRHSRRRMIAASGVPIATRLARARTQMARVAACRLSLELYWHSAPPSRLMVRGIITRALAQSLEPALRLTAVTVLQRLAQRMARWDLEWIVLLCDTAVSDRDTMVRRGGFEFCLRVLHRLPYLFPSTNKNAEELHLQRCKLVAVLKRLVDDQDASVRHAVAAHCCSLCCLLGGGKFGDQWSTWVVDTLHNFLRDPDMAVRSAALDDVPYIIILLNGFAHHYVYGTRRKVCSDVSPETGAADSSLEQESSCVDNVCQWDEVADELKRCREDMMTKAGSGETCACSDALATAEASVEVAKRCMALLLPALLKLVHEQPMQTRMQVATVAGQLLGHMATEMRWHRRLASSLTLSSNKEEKGSGGNSSDAMDKDQSKASVSAMENLASVYLTPLLLPLLADEKDAVRVALLGEVMGKELWALNLNTSAHLALDVAGEGGGTALTGIEDSPGLTPPPQSCTSVRPLSHGIGGVRYAKCTVGQVRASMVTSAPVLPQESMKSILSSLWDLAGRRDWRTRQLAPRGVLAFAAYIRSTSQQEEFAQVCVRLMKDHVASVRVTAVECLCLTALLETNQEGEEGMAAWRDAVVFPHLELLSRKALARDRLLALYMVQILVPFKVLSEEKLVGDIIPLLVAASEDVLPNVRLGAARTISILVLVLEAYAVHPGLRSCLSRLGNDTDSDVAYTGGRMQC